MNLKESIEAELPHLKYVIECLHSQGLSSGALPEIHGNLKNAVIEINNKSSTY